LAATLADENALAMRIEGGDGATIEHVRGVPAATIARFASAPEGELRVIVGRGGTGLRCATVRVKKGPARLRPRTAGGDAVWPIERKWTGAEEALYSAWVRALFHAPRGEELAKKALHEVTSAPGQNLLHDHFRWGEDDGDTKVGLRLKPDCADTPYFLRAYFSWKRGLPFAFRQCSRGSAGKAPRCGALKGVARAPEHGSDGTKPGELGIVQRYFSRTLAWGVHTGNGRTAFGDDDTDFYPLALTRKALRPGAIYADPYGHVFVLVELMDPAGTQPGVLYAIDGQPDGSITRKRFWEGNFLWNPDPALGGSGFKAFRPVDVAKSSDGRSLVTAGDDAIAKRSGYGDVSDEQSELEATQFYDRMDALVTPGRRDALLAQSEAIQALLEAAKVRVTSVANGEEHFAKGGGTIAMPDGHAIFETTGAWENFATPARDLRLLIAIDVVVGFEHKVERNPEAFLAKGGDMKALVAELQSARAATLKDPKLAFSYTRSDGSPWTVTLADLIERTPALEMAYNPNDCPELRWGAKPGSDEAKTCKRRMSAEQQRKMAAYRPWFHERRRPARGDPGPPAK
ncbi:MAG TPA: hypothetical protein VFG69_01025, partial [Nannocystaceae bacterium]|nr:hypothetical protein [Nannocystaceae bacterium]